MKRAIDKPTVDELSFREIGLTELLSDVFLIDQPRLHDYIGSFTGEITPEATSNTTMSRKYDVSEALRRAQVGDWRSLDLACVRGDRPKGHML
jgi:hypothetical protein